MIFPQNTDLATATLLSDAEYLAMPNEPGKHEPLDGELISMPPAAGVHCERG